MWEIVKDMKTGEIQPWESHELSMKKWLLDHPPYYYWNMISDDKKTIQIYDGHINRDGKDDLCYVIKCSNYKVVMTELQIMERELRDTTAYPLVMRQPGLGISDDAVQTILEHYPPKHYGTDGAGNWYSTGYPKTGWGYGVSARVFCDDVRYPDGSRWDTYQNEYKHVKDDPTLEQRVRGARRINIQIGLTLGTRFTPSKIIDKAVRLPYDPELIRLLKEVFE